MLESARRLDREDELKDFRSEFYLPLHSDGNEKLYFCGHSLGLQPKSVQSSLQEETKAWRDYGVDGHFKGRRPWTRCQEYVLEPLADLAGAKHSEIVVMNSLTVNLHLMMVSFYRPNGKRRKILIEKQAFPSDRYAVVSQILFHGLEPEDCLLELEPRPGDRHIEEADIEAFLQEQGDSIALVLWPGVQYASGQAFDLERIGAASRAAGANVGFDLAHSMGNLPLALHESACDFAVWCNYKYLNSGPGAVAGCFVHERHLEQLDLPRFTGWWGHDMESRFEMGPEFKPGPGAGAWQISNPPILSMAPLRASLDIFGRAGMESLRTKSIALTGYLAERIESGLENVLEIITPSNPERRGCQLSLRVRAGQGNGRALFDYLKSNGALCDWREPDIIRVAPVPLYNRFEDCHSFAELVKAWSLPGSYE